MKQNRITITRRPGNDDTLLRCTLKLEFDVADTDALDRFGRILHEAIPPDEQARFLSDYIEAAREAGINLQ